MVAGMDHVRILQASPADGYALSPAALAAAMDADLAAGRLPCFVCATIGTTSSCAVDPVGDLGEVARARGASCRPWLHVDAAYAGSASILPEMDEHFKVGGWVGGWAGRRRSSFICSACGDAMQTPCGS